MDILGTSNARLNVRSSGGVVTSVFSHDNWDGARGVIGTDSNHPLTFTTNYTHRMMIDTAGNVGIGTTALAYKLTVRAASTHLQLRRESTETTGGKHVFLELLQNDPAPVKVPEVYPSIRFHHNNRFWDRIEARPDGFHFKTGDLNSDNYVDVRAGRISSSMWKATRLFDRKPGPLPVEERFSSSGGTLVVFTSGTAYKSPGGFMSLQITIDGTADRFIDVFTNEANSHKAFPTTVEIFTGIAAGTHTFKIAVWSNTAVADTNDRFYATILELPF